MTQQRISLFKLFNESNSLQIGGSPERQVREVRYDAETQEVRVTYPGCFGWAVFKDQLCPYVDNGVIVTAEGFFTNDPHAGATVHLLFMHQNLDPLQHYQMRDRKSNCLIDRIGPPPAPFVYRLEDSEGFRRLFRYLRLPGDGNHQRTFIDSASLDDDNGLRRLLQQTRDCAAEDGGEGYYDTEMIWLQKGHQIGSVDGPPIPPIPTNLDTSKLPKYEPQLKLDDVLDTMRSAGSSAEDIDSEYKAGLAFFRDHLQACEQDLAMAKNLVEVYERGDKVVQQLAEFSKQGAAAAKAEIVKSMHENVRVNLWLERKPR